MRESHRDSEWVGFVDIGCKGAIDVNDEDTERRYTKRAFKTNEEQRRLVEEGKEIEKEMRKREKCEK